MQRIEQRLRQGMGLDAETIGSSSLQRIVRLRMKAAGAATVEDYERMLNTSATEWNQLVEAVVITETWFFRDRQAFSALANMVLLDGLPGKPGGQVRILSLPCSSGEEPYSIAMALLDAGVPPGRFAIDGVAQSHDRQLRQELLPRPGPFVSRPAFQGRGRWLHAQPAGAPLRELQADQSAQ